MYYSGSPAEFLIYALGFKLFTHFSIDMGEECPKNLSATKKDRISISAVISQLESLRQGTNHFEFKKWCGYPVFES
ncbi:hypothetical protein ACFFUR_06515 [Echinicola jeungdonensis]|uniref:Transposase n=2 Tax=Echinicola jeungdonensis TaxID=709343 RepID=A0ABV5J3P1_9BACT